MQRIEVASFVNPKRVPQMADAEAKVLEAAQTHDAASYIGLVLNERGFERARATAVDEVSLVVMVTDTFSQEEPGHDHRRASPRSGHRAARPGRQAAGES